MTSLLKSESKGEVRMNHHSQQILNVFDEIFNEKKCAEFCKESKFIKRSSSRLKGAEFIKAMIIPGSELGTCSLKNMCMRIKDFNPEADISAQALSERINSISAVSLIRAVFRELRQSIYTKAMERYSMLKSPLAGFNSVKIEDSTSITLNEKLEGTYKGTNRGGNVISQIKINMISDFMKGVIIDASLHEGKVPDQALAGNILRYVEEGDLIIRDLGYFCLRIFNEIIGKGAYILSRFQPNVKVYLSREDKEPVELGKYVNRHSYGQVMDMDVFIGEMRLPMRLICYPQPKEVTEKRLREANERAKRTGRTLSQSKKLCMYYTFFITNVPKEMLEAKIVGTIYRLRWECELIFKRWKSQLYIDYLKGTNANRIECLIWSRLCTILILEMINGYIANILDTEISEAQVISYLLRDSLLFWMVKNNKIEELLEKMEKDASRMLVKDRRTLKTMRERVQLKEGYYETQTFYNKRVA
jgi:hypothetical protein